MSEEELKGDLEIIVNYMGSGLIKTRKKDVKNAELPLVMRDMFVALMKVHMKTLGGEFPDNAMPLYSDEQFREA